MDHFDALQSLLELDPILLYDIVYICPKNDLVKLFSKILPYISMSFVAYQLKKVSYLNKEEVRMYVQLFSALLYYVCV